jgi:hypothetical protein
MDLILQFSEAEIGYWASVYRGVQTLWEREREDRLIGLVDDIQKRGEMTREELLDVQMWKSRHRITLIEENTDLEIRAITRDAFEATDDWKKISLLTGLSGMHVPRASVVLHLYDKKPFPMADRYAKKSIGFSRSYTQSFWRSYCKFTRDIAKRNGFTMRTLDRALWAWGWYHS